MNNIVDVSGLGMPDVPLIIQEPHLDVVPTNKGAKLVRKINQSKGRSMMPNFRLIAEVLDCSHPFRDFASSILSFCFETKF